MCLAFFFVLQMHPPAQAQNTFRPLSDAFNQEKSLTMMNYVMQRCAGLMMEMAHRTERGENREGDQELINFMKAGYEAYANQSAELTNQIKSRTPNQSSLSLKEALQTILEIQRQYFQDMEANYNLTGNSLSTQVVEDLALCSKIIRGEN